ncbi:MAG: cadmium-translocating P-type ATPase [Bacilli bacterium]|nr:cadmium-translocating P-type ATPase [Bacilli bacterium]
MKKINLEECKIIGGIILFLLGLILKNITLLSNILFILSYIIIGSEVVIESVKHIVKGKLFDESFLMTLATLGAFCIGEITEAVIVMLLFQIGEFLQDRAISKSKKSISNLMELKSETALVRRGIEELVVSLKDVQIGELVIVKAGEKIPLDGVVVEGETYLDTKALTGENIPVNVKVGDNILSGSINFDSPIVMKVLKSEAESTVTKILELIMNASDKKTKTEKFMTRFSKIYTPVVVLSALLIAIIPSILFGNISIWIYRAIIFLVLSCPCALVISIPLGFFYGIGQCSSIGMLVKGSTELELLGKVKSIAFDKTGTLTEGVFEVTEVNTTMEKELFLDYVFAVEQYSNHPIAHSILKFKTTFSDPKAEGVREIPGRGITGVLHGKNVLIGNYQLFEESKITAPKVEAIGTVLYVALDNDYVGYIVISDVIKENAKEMIKNLRKEHVDYLVMISGDRKETVSAISSKLTLDDCYSELLPTDKVSVMENLLKEKQRPFAFVGDGMNDAPVLALSDLGISMGGIGSDAAIEASDIVIMNDDLSVLSRGIKIARKSLSIIRFNITMAISVKVFVLFLGIFGISSIWFAIFADVGVTLLAILNSLRISSRKIV